MISFNPTTSDMLDLIADSTNPITVSSELLCMSVCEVNEPLKIDVI